MAVLSTSGKGADQEKPAHVAERTLDSGGEDSGYGDLQVLSTSDSDSLKKTQDGKTVLIPQPSDSSNDPLNWSFVRLVVLLLGDKSIDRWTRRRSTWCWHPSSSRRW